MNTNRLTINNIDLSTTLVDETSAVTGYTVVRSKGGSSVPVKFTGGSRVADFTAIFGTGGKDEPDVYEAYTFLNAGYDLYVSAPYKKDTAKIPYAAVTNKGIMMLSSKLDYSKVEDFATGGPLVDGVTLDGNYMIEVKHLGDYFSGITVSDLGTTGFKVSGTATDSAFYTEFVDTSLNFTLVTANGKTYSEITGSKNEDGQVTFTNFPTDVTTLEGACLYVKSGTIAKSCEGVSVKGYLFPKFPTKNNIDVTFATPAQVSTVTVGNINSTNISFALDNVDTDQVYICYTEVDSSVADPALATLAPISFRGCEKEYDDKSIEDGWEKAVDISDSIDLFFDPICHEIGSSKAAPTGTFFGLANRNRYMGLAGYIFNVTAAPSEVANIPTLSYGPNYWSICNQAVINPASANSFYSSMVGARAVMQARIIEKNYGGSAPMYINDGNGLGGQLGSLVGSSKLRYSFKDPDVRQKFANKNYNVVISDPNYGVLITAQMTCKSGALTDWSYIGHACAFLNLQKLIWDNVMTPQVGKANNPYYRELRAQQVQRYLDVRTGGSNSIWAAATVDTSTAPGVNDAAARKANKFVITVKVKVNIFSETVTLNFVNFPQDATL